VAASSNCRATFTNSKQHCRAPGDWAHQHDLQSGHAASEVELDREKARTLGVTVDSVFATLQTYLSGLYVNDFVRFGRVFKVFLQAESQFTDKPDDIGQFYVRNSEGGMVPLNTLVKISKMSGPNVVTRFNLYNAAEIMGAPARATVPVRR